MIVFFGVSALIYLIEGAAPFGEMVRKTLSALAKKHPDLGSAVSRLAWLECRVGPIKSQRRCGAGRLRCLFSRPDLVWVEMTREVVELAAAIRVKHGLRTPDALHAASCLQLGHRHIFLTGDAAFKRVVGLNVTILG